MNTATVARVTELNRVVRFQATSQSEPIQTLTRAVTTLAEAQTKTEGKIDQLVGIVEKPVERLG